MANPSQRHLVPKPQQKRSRRTHRAVLEATEEPGSSLDHLQAASIQYRIAIGPHAGRKALP